MHKQGFLDALRSKLSGLPSEDIEERITFYSEIIDDRIEDGASEDEAISDIGSVDEIVAQIVTETPLIKIVKKKMTPKRRIRAWEIVLLVLGSPIWLSLLIAAFAVMISMYAVLWSVIVSLWSVFASFIGCSLGGIIAGIGFALYTNTLSGFALIGAAIFCAGCAIFSFYGCKAATKGMARLTKKIAFGIKNCLIKKEEA